MNRPNADVYHKAICEEEGFVSFIGTGAVGGVVDTMLDLHRKNWVTAEDKEVQVPCTTMAAILKQSNVKRINFFSLDVEGAEEAVL